MYRWETECGFPLTEYSVLIFSCRSYILHHSVNICQWELEGLLEKGEILQFYYGTNILLKHFFPPTERLNWNIWIHHFLLINKRDLKKQYVPSGQAILVKGTIWGRRKCGCHMLKQISLGCKHTGSVVQQLACREMTWPWEVHENQGPDGQCWLCKINQLWMALQLMIPLRVSNPWERGVIFVVGMFVPIPPINSPYCFCKYSPALT